MVENYGNLSPLPEERPACSGEFVEDSSWRHAKDGADNSELTDQVTSESGFVDKSIGKSILTEKQFKSPSDGNWSSGLLSHPFDENSASLRFFNSVTRAPKRTKLSFMESPNIEGLDGSNFKLESGDSSSIEEAEPRRAPVGQDTINDLWINSAMDRGNKDEGFYDTVLRAHKRFFQTPYYYYRVVQFVTGAIARNLSSNNAKYWAIREELSHSHSESNSQNSGGFSGWYDKVCSYILNFPNIKDHIFDHFVCAAMVAVYYAFENKKTAIIFSVGLFTLYYHRTGRNVIFDNVFTYLIARLEKLFSEAVRTRYDYFGLGGNDDDSNPSQDVSKIYEWLNSFNEKGVNTSFVTESGDGDDESKGLRGTIKSIEGFYKDLQKLKLTSLLMGVTGVVAVSGFCALTGRSHEEIADFDVSEYMNVEHTTVSQIWEAIKAIYTDVRIYFDFRYLSDKKRTYWEFRELRKKLIEWEDKGKELSMHIPNSAWSTMDVCRQLKWRLEYNQFREYAEKELMALKNFEVVHAVYGKSKKVLQIKNMYNDLSNHYMCILSHKFRPATFGINIEGGTCIAKSSILVMMQQFILEHHLKIDKQLTKQLTYYYSGDDSAFWDGACSSHLLCVMDDVDKYLQDIEPEGNKGIKALLAIMNNLPFNLNQAQLELKGKVYALYYAIIGTSNTITGLNGRSTLDVSGIYKHPGAIARRFRLVLQVSPSPEFDNGFGAIDTKKLAEFQRDNPGKAPDAWSIRCLRTTASNDGYKVSQPKYQSVPNPRLVQECDDDLSRARLTHGDNLYVFDITDLFNMLCNELEEHDRIQQQFFELSERGIDFEELGVRPTSGVPLTFRDMLGDKVDPPAEELTTESGLPYPATGALSWIYWLLCLGLMYHLIGWLYDKVVHAWYSVYDAYEGLCFFFVLCRRTGSFMQTVRYYRDSSRLSNWVDRHKFAIACIAGTSAASAVAIRVFKHFSKRDDKETCAGELQSGDKVRTVPVQHAVDSLPRYEHPRSTPAVRLSTPSLSIQEGHLACGGKINKTFVIKLSFLDSTGMASDTHGTVLSYAAYKSPRVFFNKHALEKWTRDHKGPWCIRIHGVIAQSDEPAVFQSDYFLSLIVQLPVGDKRDLIIFDLRPPPRVGYTIRAFVCNEPYLLSKENFIDATGKMKNTLVKHNVSLVKMFDDEMRVNNAGQISNVVDDIKITDLTTGTYDMGPCIVVNIPERTGPGECGSPYLLQRVHRPQIERIVECAFVGIHGAGSSVGDHIQKLIVPVYADDMALPSPESTSSFSAEIKPEVTFSADSGELKDVSLDEFASRREVFAHYEQKACRYPVLPEQIMHLPNIEVDERGQMRQHDKSVMIEDNVKIIAGSLFSPIGRFDKSTDGWLQHTLGYDRPTINDTSAHLYGTCRTIDVRVHDVCKRYTVGIGKLTSDWNLSPLHDDLSGYQLSSVDEIIFSDKIPPHHHLNHVKNTQCLKGNVDYKKLSATGLSHYDIAVVLSDIMSQPVHDRTLAGKMLVAADHYLDSVLAKIDVKTEIHRYPIEEGIPINGLVNEQGVRYQSLDGLEMNTSAGPPFTSMYPGAKGKHHWLIEVERHADGRIDRAMGETLEYFVDECRSRMLKGHRVVHQIFWKDEPAKPVSEGNRKPKRPIFIAPLYFNILMREYLLSLNRTMAAFPFVFQQAVGFDSSSVQWEQIRKYVFGSDSSNWVFDGDYRKFDRRLLQEVTDSVRYFIVTLCAKSGNYSEDDMIIMNNILKCATSPIVNVFGTLYGFRSLNTSGNPLTTQINCIANNILIWYVFLEKYNNLNYADAHLLYINYVRAMVYGDDNIVGCVPHPEYGQVITCNDMQDKLKCIIEYTDAAKNSIVQPYAPHEEITLLGRYFIQEEGRVLDRFELSRLWRMLLTYKYRSSVPVSVCLKDIYDSALYELARYHKDLFDEVRELLIEGLSKLQFKETGREYTHDQIVRTFFYSNKGEEHTYEFYRNRYMEHIKHGYIQDPRFEECCPKEFSLESGECYHMDTLPNNATEFERHCFIWQDLGTIPLSYVCGSNYLGPIIGFEVCSLFFLINKLIFWHFIPFLIQKSAFVLSLVYAFRFRPHLMPGPLLAFVIQWMWHHQGVHAAEV